MRIALGGGNWEFNLVLLDKWGTVGMAMGLPRLQLWAYVQWVLAVAWAESNKFGVYRTYVCVYAHTYIRTYVCTRMRTYVHVGMLCVGYYTANSVGLSAQFAMRDVNHELIAG